MIAEPVAGYYLDDSSARVEMTVPLGSIAELDDQGIDGARTAVANLEHRRVILPSVRPEQYEVL
jgi:hypothetical protein